MAKKQKNKWDAATVAKMVVNPGDRSKIPTRYLPDNYRQMRVRNQWTPAKVAQAVGNPGTRANVPVGLLPEKYRRVREQNERFASPITPGSSVTYGQVARDRKAAEALEFGADPVGKARANEAQTAAWYDAYQRELEQHRVRQEGYGRQAVSQFANMAGTAGQVPAGLSAENAAVASNAQGVRDQLRAGLGQEMATRAATANTVASALQANGLLEKAQAVKKQRDATQAVRDKLGAWRSQYMSTARDNEAKNVLALSIAKDKTAADLASEAARLRQSNINSIRNNNTSRQNNRDDNATSRQNNSDDNATSRQNNSDDNATRRNRNTRSPWLSTGEQNTFRNTLDQARAAVRGLQRGGASRDDAANMLRRGGNGLPKIGNELALSVALDTAYNSGRVSRRNVKRLHDSGYKIGLLDVNVESRDPGQRRRDAASYELRNAGDVMR